MKTRTIEFNLKFPAKPEKVYNLLMDGNLHALITGGKVRMSSKTDGKFEVWDGYCHGFNIELKEGRKIVQAWHFDEDNWPANHYSICTFLFSNDEQGCRLHFEQSEVPETSYENLRKGWKEHYWDRMIEILKEERKPGTE